MTYLDELLKRVQETTGCKAAFEQFTPVTEAFNGQVAWNGQVASFLLTGHSRARRCYAWGFPTAEEAKSREITTVLEIPPVVSPETAVMVAIAAKSKTP